MQAVGNRIADTLIADKESELALITRAARRRFKVGKGSTRPNSLQNASCSAGRPIKIKVPSKACRISFHGKSHPSHRGVRLINDLLYRVWLRDLEPRFTDIGFRSHPSPLTLVDGVPQLVSPVSKCGKIREGDTRNLAFGQDMDVVNKILGAKQRVNSVKERIVPPTPGPVPVTQVNFSLGSVSRAEGAHAGDRIDEIAQVTAVEEAQSLVFFLLL